MSVSKPPSVTVFPWLRDNLGKGCLGVLTNVDIRALRASAEIIELYSYCRHPAKRGARDLCASVMSHFGTNVLSHCLIAGHKH